MSLSADILEPRGVFLVRWLAALLLILGAHIGCTVLALTNWQVQEVADAAGGARSVARVPAPPGAAHPPDAAPGPPVEEAMLAPPPTLERKDVPLPEEQPKLEPAPLAPEPEAALPNARPIEAE